jgi:hypothetical protein
MSMEELKKQLAPVHKKLNDNLEQQQKLLEEYEALLQESIELTDSYFQQIKAQLNAKEETRNQT